MGDAERRGGPPKGCTRGKVIVWSCLIRQYMTLVCMVFFTYRDIFSDEMGALFTMPTEREDVFPLWADSSCNWVDWETVLDEVNTELAADIRKMAMVHLWPDAL